MKIKTIYACQKCGFQSPKWLGRCPDCQEWNSFSEENEIIAPKSSGISASRHRHGPVNQPMQLSQHREQPVSRFTTRFPDLNAVLGGGVKIGSLILLSGEPGIGKSTLTLELCADAVRAGQNVLYVSGEESGSQIASRAHRLQIGPDQISLLAETCLENVLAQIDSAAPQMLVIDSIQVLYSLDIGSLPGSISQIRYCTERLMETCKSRDITCLIVGHVNKDGELAGPKVLEHLVDTVLFIEGERHQQLRLIRGLKNRFGSTNDVAIMEMTATGLKEIANPSELFLQGRQPNALGSAITVTLEGSRPLLLEVQALTNATVFGYPKRSANGFDLNRLQLIAAVLQKYLKINLNGQDIFANVVGGVRIGEPAADLGLAMAIVSSFRKIPLPEKAIFLGEIGLSGELRPASNLQKRIREAEKLGFETLLTAKTGQLERSKNTAGKLKILTAGNLQEAAQLFFS
jgi:DNA repair protein RadA/Sms